MDIQIVIKDFMDSVEEEISRIAAGSYSEDGAPLYDGMKKTSRDDGTMERLFSESLTTLKNALARFLEGSEQKDGKLSIVLAASGRRIRGKEDMIEDLVKSSLAKVLISKYFLEKQQTEQATKFDTLAAADLQALQNVIYTKSTPTYNTMTTA